MNENQKMITLQNIKFGLDIFNESKIGLLISETILKQFGGEIFIESSPNNGSIFTMKFKLIAGKSNIKYISAESSLLLNSERINQNYDGKIGD